MVLLSTETITHKTQASCFTFGWLLIITRLSCTWLIDLRVQAQLIYRRQNQRISTCIMKYCYIFVLIVLRTHRFETGRTLGEFGDGINVNMNLIIILLHTTLACDTTISRGRGSQHLFKLCISCLSRIPLWLYLDGWN